MTHIHRLNADGSVAPSLKLPTSAIIVPVALLILAIFIAYKKKFGPWGYVGMIALSGIVGSGISRAIIMVANKETIEKNI